MISNLSNFEDEIYALKIESILEAFEYDIQVKANAAISMMLARVDELMTIDQPITEKQLDRITSPLNRLIATEIGQAMVATQAALREVAAQQGEVTSVAPYFTAGTLMRQATMDGTSMAEWFRSAVLPNGHVIIDEIQKGIEAGWDRHRCH